MPARTIAALALAALASVAPAHAQQPSPHEEAVMGALERLDDMVLLICDHGVKPGATLVTYRRTLRADRSGYDFVGLGPWSGAEIEAASAQTVSLRFSLNFMLIQGQLTQAVPTAIARGVIDGETVEGPCESMKGDLVALIPNLFFDTK